MLNNVMKTASSTMIAQLCHFGDVVKTFATCMRQASEKLDEMDWRHPFVVAVQICNYLQHGLPLLSLRILITCNVALLTRVAGYAPIHGDGAGMSRKT